MMGKGVGVFPAVIDLGGISSQNPGAETWASSVCISVLGNYTGQCFITM